LPVIPTYFHVISASNKTADGYLGTKSIQAQIGVLNDAFNNTGLSFKLAGTDCEYTDTLALQVYKLQWG